jgi:hypothetical protein
MEGPRRATFAGRAEGEGEMNELEPETEASQWLWFGAALLAMRRTTAEPFSQKREAILGHRNVRCALTG